MSWAGRDVTPIRCALWQPEKILTLGHASPGCPLALKRGAHSQRDINYGVYHWLAFLPLLSVLVSPCLSNISNFFVLELSEPSSTRTELQSPKSQPKLTPFVPAILTCSLARLHSQSLTSFSLVVRVVVVVSIRCAIAACAERIRHVRTFWRGFHLEPSLSLCVDQSCDSSSYLRVSLTVQSQSSGKRVDYLLRHCVHKKVKVFCVCN